MKFANGMAITLDGSTLLVAESMGQRITAFTLGDDGILTDRRVWAQLQGPPDGITVDRDNGVWFANPVSNQFVRVTEGGEVTETITTPGRHAIACALGGSDGHTLFLLTSTTLGGSDQARRARGAAVDTTRVRVPAA